MVSKQQRLSPGLSETAWNGNSRAHVPGVEDTAVARACTDIANGVRSAGSSRAPAIHGSTANWLWEAFTSVPRPLCRLPLCTCVSLEQVTCRGWVALGSCCHCWLQPGSAVLSTTMTHTCHAPSQGTRGGLTSPQAVWCKSGSLGNPCPLTFMTI